MPNYPSNPSSRYAELIQQYRKLHLEGEPNLNLPSDRTFPGTSVFPQASRIKSIIRRTGATTLLDYGCGKGKQYEARNIEIPGEGVFETLQDYWDLDFIYCFDPAYPRFSRAPDFAVGGVICTDVLEHCHAEDLTWIVDELFSHADSFVFASVAGHPAKKLLPNGENAHCTQKPPDWWKGLFESAAVKFPQIVWELWHHVKNPSGGFDEVCITGGIGSR